MSRNSWRLHPDHDDILVSDDGHILRRKRGKWHELNQYDNKRGYMRIGTADKSVHQCVHTLVAETFVENPDPVNKKYVNHIDGNPGHIHECLNGGRHTHKKYHYEYVDGGDV